MDKETEKKIQQLSMLEQNAQNTTVQKQNFQVQLTEVDSALKEIDNSDDIYKIVSNIMVKSEPKKLKKELTDRKEMIEIRIQSLEKQEKKLKEKASSLQKEVLEKIEKK
ncbi:MAG: Prefoldin subunit beta [Candidatus Woesearchaeota archaeon]|nr:Prefoldin subunit beta [Candidatus Woesearchaeota archaeon]